MGRLSRLVEDLLDVSRITRSALVLDAMRRVPREAFLPRSLGEFAYEDSPLPIEAEQTISQPYIVAFMIEALELEGGEKVLEIGTGSGYQAAVLAELAGEVITVERHAALAEAARARLADLGYTNVTVLVGDGSVGYAARAPYDGILVAAAAPRVPEAIKLQLSEGGRLVIPVGPPGEQDLVVIRRGPDGQFVESAGDPCVFVPLVGQEGWPG